MRQCPKCGIKYKRPPAISRKDNKTEICPPCGSMEALKDFKAYKKQQENK